MNLQSSETRLKRQLSQVHEKLRHLEGRKRFDPSKAFAHENQENVKPLTDSKEA